FEDQTRDIAATDAWEEKDDRVELALAVELVKKEAPEKDKPVAAKKARKSRPGAGEKPAGGDATKANEAAETKTEEKPREAAEKPAEKEKEKPAEKEKEKPAENNPNLKVPDWMKK